MKIIAISGHAGSGKDTIASILAKKIEGRGESAMVTHYADVLKYICRTYLGWDGKKDTEGRSLLQYVGTDICRKKDINFFVNFMVSILGFFEDMWDYAILSDVRFQNEIDGLTSAGFDVFHLRVSRPGFDNSLTSGQKEHPSETALDSVRPDAVIINNKTTDELEQMCEKLIDLIGDQE